MIPGGVIEKEGAANLSNAAGLPSVRQADADGYRFTGTTDAGAGARREKDIDG